MINYSVSGRKKNPDISIQDFLNLEYMDLDKDKVSTVFGFVEKSSLYGGRIFEQPELSNADVEQLYRLNIGLKLPLTNHYITEAEYQNNFDFLKKYHRKGNSIALVNDDLARWIKRDFPKYELEASVIKNIHTQTTINKYLELYDIIVLPMDLYNNLENLQTLEPKNKLRFFGQSACAYNCPAKICYKTISKINKLNVGEGADLFKCSKSIKQRDIMGFQEFDINLLIKMGFTNFKMIRNIHKKKIEFTNLTNSFKWFN